jgi:hypothetical protein
VILRIGRASAPPIPAILLADWPLNVSSDATASSATVATVATEPVRRDDAERRQLSLMFTDVVGSMALSTKLDLEVMRSVIGAYHKCVAETVARFDVVRCQMGDGVLVYFGYPHAHEDDAERAVRASLALIEAVGKLRVQEPLHVRIGVATGLVVVGDIVGSGEARNWGGGRDAESGGASQRNPHRMRSSSLKAPDGFSATSSSCGTWGGRTSRALPCRRRPGPCCGRVPLRAASRRYGRPA